MISQVHLSAAAGSRIFGAVHPQDLLEQPEGVLQVEAAQERLPAPVHVFTGGAGARDPQPYRLGVAVDRASDRPAAGSACRR